MRVCIVALGSRGDVQPLVTLGSALRTAHHDVCVAAELEFEQLVKSFGLEYSLVYGDVRRAVQTDVGRQLFDGKRISPLARIGWNTFDQRVAAGVRQRFADIWQAAKNADAIVVAAVGLVTAYSMAEKLGRPLIRVLYSPPEVPLTRGFRSRPLLNQLTGRLFLQGTWSLFRPATNRARREVLGLPPLPLFNFQYPLERKRWPILCAFSSHVDASARDQRGSLHVTGYWFPPASNQWEPPRELTAFLAAGPPPVCVGFGSTVHQSPEATTRLVMEALARAGQRGILVRGWGGLNGAATSDDVLVIDDAPFDWLFPRCAAMVHHGGAGTTAASFRAGRPTVVVPFGMPEQPFWGERIATLGVGPAPLNRKHLTAERLAKAIRTMVGDEAMQRRAAVLGERIRAEDGVARAVEVVEMTA